MAERSDVIAPPSLPRPVCRPRRPEDHVEAAAAAARTHHAFAERRERHVAAPRQTGVIAESGLRDYGESAYNLLWTCRERSNALARDGESGKWGNVVIAGHHKMPELLCLSFIGQSAPRTAEPLKRLPTPTKSMSRLPPLRLGVIVESVPDRKLN